MSQVLYVVFGSTGEYSDRSEWPVRAFAREAAAADLVVAATARAKEIEATRSTPYTQPLGNNEFDPDMQMDYTGTSYYVQAVPLDDDVRADIAAQVQEDVTAGRMRRAMALDGQIVEGKRRA